MNAFLQLRHDKTEDKCVTATDCVLQSGKKFEVSTLSMLLLPYL